MDFFFLWFFRFFFGFFGIFGCFDIFWTFLDFKKIFLDWIALDSRRLLLQPSQTC